MLGARDALSAGQTNFGDHHLSLTVRVDDLALLDGAIAQAGAALADMGAVAVRISSPASPPGSARASMPGCSTTKRTSWTSSASSSAST